VNEELSNNASLINESPYEKGWIAKIKLSGSLPKDLLDSNAYEKFCKEDHH